MIRNILAALLLTSCAASMHAEFPGARVHDYVEKSVVFRNPFRRTIILRYVCPNEAFDEYDDEQTVTLRPDEERWILVTVAKEVAYEPACDVLGITLLGPRS